MSRTAIAALLAVFILVGLGLIWMTTRPGSAALARFAAPVVAAGPQLPSPIAQASHGLVQCYSPDVARKTCLALAAFERTPDGRILQKSDMVVSNKPLVTMQSVSLATIESNQLCGHMRSLDIETAGFVVEGRPATTAQTAQLKRLVRAALADFLGRKGCTVFEQQAGHLLAKTSLEAVHRSDLDQKVIWVSPPRASKSGRRTPAPLERQFQ